MSMSFTDAIEQCVLVLLADGETAGGDGDTRPIVRGGRLVGYIDITDAEPVESRQWPRWTPP